MLQLFETNQEIDIINSQTGYFPDFQHLQGHNLESQIALDRFFLDLQCRTPSSRHSVQKIIAVVISHTHSYKRKFVM